MKERYREVEAWLVRTFAGSEVPRFELSESTLEVLAGLMKINEQQDQAAELVRLDWEQREEEYSSEADRLQRVLSRLELTPSSLSQNAMVALKTLVSLSLMLDTQSTSATHLLLTINEVSEEKFRLAEQLQLERRLAADLSLRINAQLQRLVTLKRALRDAEQHAEKEGPELEEKASNMEFLRKKIEDYRETIEQRKKELSTAGVDPSIFHRTLLAKAEELRAQQEKLHAVKVKLDAYKALPPDVSLARVKVEEAKRELARLEKEIMDHIDPLHL